MTRTRLYILCYTECRENVIEAYTSFIKSFVGDVLLIKELKKLTIVLFCRHVGLSVLFRGMLKLLKNFFGMQDINNTGIQIVHQIRLRYRLLHIKSGVW